MQLIDLDAMSAAEIGALAAMVSEAIQRREDEARSAARRAAFVAVRGPRCDWCLVEDQAVPVLQQGKPTGLHVGPECRSRSAFLVSPEQWQEIRAESATSR